MKMKPINDRVVQ